MIFYKISNSWQNALPGTIFIEKGSINFSSKIAYASTINEDHEMPLDLSFAINKKPDAKKVYLTIDGDSVRTIVKNDSLAVFYVHFRKVSIKYNVDSINDIVISTKEDELKGDELPMNLAFVKHHNSLYLIVMSLSSNEEQQLLPNALLQMLK